MRQGCRMLGTHMLTKRERGRKGGHARALSLSPRRRRAKERLERLRQRRQAARRLAGRAGDLQRTQPIAMGAAGLAQFTHFTREDDMHKDTLEQTLWKMDLLSQAVRGIAHRGASGDIKEVDDETLPVEDLIRGIKADLERA